MYKFFEEIAAKFIKRPNVMDISKEELKKISDIFFISRTGVEMLDFIKNNPLPYGQNLPSIFNEIYDKNRKTEEEYNRLDQKLMNARDESTGVMDYREKAEKIHYANCTSLACFLHESLKEKDIHSRIFGLGGAHHFVIAKDNNPNSIIVIDPWANTIFKMDIKKPFDSLEELSSEDRLEIAKQHYQHTNLYPNYKTGLDEVLSSDPTRSKKMEDNYIKQFFEICSTDRFFEFEENKNKLNI